MDDNEEDLIDRVGEEKPGARRRLDRTTKHGGVVHRATDHLVQAGMHFDRHGDPAESHRSVALTQLTCGEGSIMRYRLDRKPSGL
ncbi:MAG: hypothetical protein RIF41_05815, partial [Polyangiaceae bacterium]